MTDAELTTDAIPEDTPLMIIGDRIGRARGLVRLISAAIPWDRKSDFFELFESMDYGLIAIEDLLDEMERAVAGATKH